MKLMITKNTLPLQLFIFYGNVPDVNKTAQHSLLSYKLHEIILILKTSLMISY
jgi:hypothetical protein